MAMQATDPILAKPRADAAAYLAHLDRPDAKDRAYVAGVTKWAAVAGVDDAIVLVWFDVETDSAKSPRWNRDLNPGGIGIPRDSTVQPFVIPDGDDAARIHVQCLYSMVTGKLHPDIAIWSGAAEWMQRVWLPKVRAAEFPKVTRLTDLDVRYTGADGGPEATWAWGHQPGQPAEEAVRRANRIWPNLPDQTAESDPAPVPQNPVPTPVPTPPQNPPGALVFGRVKRPPIRMLIVRKGPSGSGYFTVPPRRIVGVCGHITDGVPGGDQNKWYADFVSIGGERANDALFDFCIATNGEIAMLNDPWGTRSPWANGGSDGIEGDGRAFVNALGVGAINSRLASVERVAKSPNRMTDVQMEASALLWAWIFDQCKVPWNSYPVNPHVGCNTDLQHFEFATKPCPGDGIRGQTTELQNAVRAILKAGQESGEPAPGPSPVPPVIVSLYPPGLTSPLAKRLYGRVSVPWATTPFAFDPERSECRAWLDRGRARLKPGEDYTAAPWPPLADVIRRGDGGRVFHFSDGTAYAQAPGEI